MSYPVGADIEALCGKCGDTWHVVVALVNGKIAKVEERKDLELDHTVPVARGGASTVANLRMLCSAHNRHAAEGEFGREHMRARREEAQRRRAAESFHRQADREIAMRHVLRDLAGELGVLRGEGR